MNDKIHRNKHPTTALEDLDNLEQRRLLSNVFYAQPERPGEEKPIWLATRNQTTRKIEREVNMVFSLFVIALGVILFAAHLTIPGLVMGVVGLISLLAGGKS